VGQYLTKSLWTCRIEVGERGGSTSQRVCGHVGLRLGNVGQYLTKSLWTCRIEVGECGGSIS
jgi:hypothetical protein